jgi:ParB family chromosome partitioning protein
MEAGMSRLEEALPLDAIVTGDRLRQLNRGTVDTLKQSIVRIGLKIPISVRYVSDDHGFDLVAGLHRFIACRELGWTEIPVREETGTSDDARMWEIAENLHRAELTALERDEHIAEWVRLCEREKPEQFAQVSGGCGKEGGVSAASRELGLERTDVIRSVKVAENLAPEAKKEARTLGLDDNQSALLKAAAEPTPEAQKQKLQEHAAKPRKARTPKAKPEMVDAQISSACGTPIGILKVDARVFEQRAEVAAEAATEATPEPPTPAAPSNDLDAFLSVNNVGDDNSKYTYLDPHIKDIVLAYEKLPPRWRREALAAMDGIGLADYRKTRKDAIRRWTIEKYKADWLLNHFGVEVTWPKFDVWVGGCGDNDTSLRTDGEPVIAGPLAAAGAADDLPVGGV